jgi:hypothetical protein
MPPRMGIDSLVMLILYVLGVAGLFAIDWVCRSTSFRYAHFAQNDKR